MNQCVVVQCVGPVLEIQSSRIEHGPNGIRDGTMWAFRETDSTRRISRNDLDVVTGLFKERVDRSVVAEFTTAVKTDDAVGNAGFVVGNERREIVNRRRLVTPGRHLDAATKAIGNDDVAGFTIDTKCPLIAERGVGEDGGVDWVRIGDAVMFFMESLFKWSLIFRVEGTVANCFPVLRAKKFLLDGKCDDGMWVILEELIQWNPRSFFGGPENFKIVRATFVVLVVRFEGTLIREDFLISVSFVGRWRTIDGMRR